MTDPQIWTLIGVFAAALFAVLTLMSTMFVRVVRAEIRGLEGKIDGVGARIDGLERRIDSLDRDVQALVKHTFGLDRD